MTQTKQAKAIRKPTSSGQTQATLVNLMSASRRASMSQAEIRRHTALTQRCLRYKGNSKSIPKTATKMVLHAVEAGNKQLIDIQNFVKVECATELTRRQISGSLYKLRKNDRIPPYTFGVYSNETFYENTKVFY